MDAYVTSPSQLAHQHLCRSASAAKNCTVTVKRPQEFQDNRTNVPLTHLWRSRVSLRFSTHDLPNCHHFGG
eukprot:1073048-Amphidinium_carterae.1